MKHISISVLAVLLALVCFTSVGYASLIAPGGNVAPPSVLTESGVLIPATFLIEPFSTSSYSGTFTTAVFRQASGTLDFLYGVSSDPSSIDNIERLTATNFTGFTTDVGFETSGGIAPIEADRSVGGNTVGFNFGLPPVGIAHGQSSDILIIRTNATGYRPGIANIIDGNIASVDAWAPSPEPVSSSLLLGGLFGVGLVVTRKFRARRQS
jgi:hypothetical protein